jgi:hypothetical protein
MVANNLSIVIRTCKQRLERSRFLKDALMCEFGVHVKILVVESSKNYSQGFVCELVRYLESLDTVSKYILVVEDDMLFSNAAKSIVEEAIYYELPHLWCSIPEKRIVDESSKLSANIRSIFLSAPLYYSGAILFESSFLKHILTNYCLTFMELVQPNFDVFVSSQILEVQTPLFLSYTCFATDPHTSSILDSSTKTKHRFTPTHIDAYFEFKDTSPLFKTNTLLKEFEC